MMSLGCLQQLFIFLELQDKSLNMMASRSYAASFASGIALRIAVGQA